MIRIAATMAGRMSGMVTLRKVVSRLAPDMSADSSSDGSMDRKAATMRRKTIGERCPPSTQIIPQMEKTSKNPGPRIGSRALLSSPMSGLARKIHATV
jgi:hypothetical protein